VSMIKRISDILTPPPFRRHGKSDEHWRTLDYEEDFNKQLRSLLKRLITARGADSQELAPLVAQIRRLGGEKGLYTTAARMRIQLESLPQHLKEGTPCCTDQAYRLAADLILQQLLKEIDAIKTTDSPLGPHILTNYCTDLTDCLIDGNDVKRAIEIPIIITDRLLWLAMSASERKEVFLGLVEPAIQSPRELIEYSAEQRLEKQQRQQALQRGEKEAPQTQETTAAPYQTWDMRGVEAALSYLHRFQDCCVTIRDAFLRFDRVPCVSKDEPADQVEPSRVSKHLEYLKGLQSIAASAGYSGFLAMVTEEAGTLMIQLDLEKGRAILRTAAHSYETQGDKEREVTLGNIAKTRYKKAHQLYIKSQDQVSAASVNAKLALP